MLLTGRALWDCPGFGKHTPGRTDISKMPEANRLRYLAFRKMREIAERS